MNNFLLASSCCFLLPLSIRALGSPPLPPPYASHCLASSRGKLAAGLALGRTDVNTPVLFPLCACCQQARHLPFLLQEEAGAATKEYICYVLAKHLKGSGSSLPLWLSPRGKRGAVLLCRDTGAGRGALCSTRWCSVPTRASERWCRSC